MRSTLLSIAVAASALWSSIASATSCPKTGVDSPKVVTLMASRLDPETEAWIVWPDCTIEVVAATVTNQEVELSIKSSQLDEVKSIPSSVTTLTFLSARLAGTVDLSGATQLKRLVLSDTVETLEQVSLPDNLEYLTLPSGGRLKRIENLEILPKLVSLDASFNNISAVNNVIFHGLESLNLSHNHLESLDFLLPPGLKYFSLSNNPIKTLGQMSFVDSLEEIDFDNTPIELIQGVQWPSSLISLKLGSVLTKFELRQSDFDRFRKLDRLKYEGKIESCTEPGELKQLGLSSVCVIPDEVFEALYRPLNDPPDVGMTKEPTDFPLRVIDAGWYNLSDGTFMGFSLPTQEDPGTPSTTNPVHTSQPNRASTVTSSTTPSYESAAHSASVSSTKSSLIIAVIAGVSFSMGVLAFVMKGWHAKEADSSHDYAELQGNTHAGPSPREVLVGSYELLGDDVRNDLNLLLFRIPHRDIQRGQIIARGGCGIIYRATATERDVVVKQMLPETWRNEDALRRFMNEIRLCSSLDHPKIVAFVGVAWSSVRDISAVFEYMPGGDLQACLHEHGRPEPSDWFEQWSQAKISSKASIAKDVAEALVYLHSLETSILHRDIKARNVLIDGQGHAKLSDFGISRQLQQDETMTSEIGTAAWIAPEVIRGERYSEKADVYSFGVLLVEMDLCAHPFVRIRGEETVTTTNERGTCAAYDNARIMVQVSSGQLVLVLTPQCPSNISKLVKECLSFAPAARPSVGVLLTQLREIVTSI